MPWETMSAPIPTTVISYPAACEICGNWLAAQLGGLCPRCLLGLADESGGRDSLVTSSNPTPGFKSCRFDDYELLEEIARGGMGVVYRARQFSLNREVALKMILSGELASPESLRMFRREAHAAAHLHHPNIVPVYEIGEHELQHYFTMRLVPGGRTIAEWAGTRRGQWRELAEATVKAARAVAFAHGHGVLHRDLKPSNILWDDLAGPQVTDFGLAKLVGEADGSLTLSSGALGSPNYMAPEQVRGPNADITTATDVYGLGAVLYELLAGRPPFRGSNVFDTLRRAAEEMPEALPDVPLDLRIICFKCLEKNPERRYRSAGAMADDLERWLRNEPITARRPGSGERLVKWVRRRPIHAALVATSLAALVALVGGQMFHTHRTNQARRLAESVSRRLAVELRRVEWQQAEEALAAGRTPDAMAAFARFLRETPDDKPAAARLRSLLESRAFPLPLLPPLVHDNPVRLVRLDPDGHRLLTVTDNGVLRSWNTSTGTLDREQPLNLRPENGYLQFLPDGHHLLAPRKEGRVIVWDLDRWNIARELGDSPTRHAKLTLGSNGEHLALVTPRDDVELWSVSTGTLLARTNLPAKDLYLSATISPAGEMVVRGEGRGMWLWKPASHSLEPMLPAGEKFVFVACDWQRRRAYISLEDQDRKTHGMVSLDLDTRRELLRNDKATAWHTLEVSPDGSQLLASQWGGGIMALETATLREILPKCVFSPVFPDPSVDPSFRVAFRTLHDGSGLLHDLRDGKTLLEPAQHEGLINSHQLSPDGGRLVTGSQDRTARLWDLRMRRTEAGLIDTGGPVDRISLSPAGDRLAVAGNRQIRIYHPSTGRQLMEPIQEPDHVPFVAFSMDGRFITTACSDTTVRLLDGTNGQQLLSNRAHTIRVWKAVLSPDAHLLASSGDNNEVHVLDVSSNRPAFAPLKHEDAVKHVEFSRDGHRLVSSSADSTARVWDAANGQSLVPPLRHKGTVWTACFSSDGRRVLTASADRSAQVWDAFTGQPVAPPIRSDQGLRGASFSRDDRRVLIYTLNGAQIFDASSSRPMTPPMRHTDRVSIAAFSPDERWVATASADGTARIWDASSGFPVTEPFRHAKAVTTLAWLWDSRHLLTGSQDGTIRQWSLPGVGRAPAWLADLAEALAGKRSEPGGGSVAVTVDRLEDLRRQAATPGSDPDQRWLHWFLIDRLEAPGIRPNAE
jgi:eukaryotic-like serine/threonine-protein kinase